MRLAELSPRWFRPYAFVDSVVVFTGITFICPHCKTQRIAVPFAPAIDPGNVRPGTTWRDDPKSWRRHSGDTFDTLTLGPSIDLSKYCHWHGHIVNGEVL